MKKKKKKSLGQGLCGRRITDGELLVTYTRSNNLLLTSIVRWCWSESLPSAYSLKIPFSQRSCKHIALKTWFEVRSARSCPAGIQRWNTIDSTYWRLIDVGSTTTAIQRWFNVSTLNQRFWINVVSTFSACWVGSNPAKGKIQLTSVRASVQRAFHYHPFIASLDMIWITLVE